MKACKTHGNAWVQDTCRECVLNHDYALAVFEAERREADEAQRAFAAPQTRSAFDTGIGIAMLASVAYGLALAVWEAIL